MKNSTTEEDGLYSLSTLNIFLCLYLLYSEDV